MITVDILKSGNYYAGPGGAEHETPHYPVPGGTWRVAVETPGGYLPLAFALKSVSWVPRHYGQEEYASVSTKEGKE